MRNPRRMEKDRSRSRRPAFTLVELLVVVLIVGLISIATIKVAIFDQGGRNVSEAARMIQAAVVGARDAAYRSNSPHGIRLLPDSEFNGQAGGALAANRIISIEAAPEYNSGTVTVLTPTPIPGQLASSTGFLAIQETTHTYVTSTDAMGNVTNSIVPYEPTSWYWNIRQGDKIRIDDSGRYYTVAGPMQVGTYNKSVNGQGGLNNVERYINFGPPGFVENLAGTAVQNDANPMHSYDPLANAGGTHFPEFLQVVNGQDDDNDGWVDEGFDGIDNDGDGIIDPGYNGIDDDGQNGIDDPAELLWSYNSPATGSPTQGYFGGEYEPEAFIGNEFTQMNIGSEKHKRYTIVRRPVVSEGAREVMLPPDVLIDLTTWNATGARANADHTKFNPTLPERSRLPVDPYSFTVDIMLGPDGQVITASAGQSAGANSGAGMASFPTSNMPFYQFWICEREDVYDPLFSSVQTVTGVDQSRVPIANPSYGASPPLTYLLPMPQGTRGEYFDTKGGITYVYYAPSVPSNAPTDHPSTSTFPPGSSNGPYLKGEMRLVTLFVKTGQVLSYDLGPSDFDPTDTNQPYMQTRFGIREAK